MRVRTIGVIGSLLLLTLAGASTAPAAELRLAAARGDTAGVAKLIAAKHPLDARDGQGQTALLLAVEGGHTEAARALIDAGADINAVAANKDTPWLLAGARGRTEILAHMIPRGPDLSMRNRYGGTALIPACHYGHLDTVQLLLGTKIDIAHVNNLGWTCLLEVMILGDGSKVYVDIVRAVLDAGANPNRADKDGMTPLAHAKRRGFGAIVRVLEAKGAR